MIIFVFGINIWIDEIKFFVSIWYLVISKGSMY